jgi:hypothetical protein
MISNQYVIGIPRFLSKKNVIIVPKAKKIVFIPKDPIIQYTTSYPRDKSIKSPILIRINNTQNIRKKTLKALDTIDSDFDLLK